MGKLALVAVCMALLVCSAVGESAMDKLRAKVSGAAPCDKVPAGPAPPRQFLDQRLPHVVDDYHPPPGGFDPTDIPSKEVDVAARKILREIQAAEAEAKANGDAPPGQKDDNGILTTEEHKALKQLLLDADILVRAASKSLSDNGPIEEAEVKKVAKSAVKKAAKAEKKAKKSKGKKAKKPKAKKAKKSKKPKAKKPKAKKPKAKKPSKKPSGKKASPKPKAKPARKKRSSKKKGKKSKKGRKGRKGKKKAKKEEKSE